MYIQGSAAEQDLLISMCLCRELVMGHAKRATNHSQLLESLKQVNTVIQQAANLRFGGPRTRVINACRQAIKENNTMLLVNIVQEGQ